MLVFVGYPNFPICELTSSGSDCHPTQPSPGGGEQMGLRMRFLRQQPYRRRFNHHQNLTPRGSGVPSAATRALCTLVFEELRGPEAVVHLLNTNLVLFSQHNHGNITKDASVFRSPPSHGAARHSPTHRSLALPPA